MKITKYTFWKLINEFSITIPIIQRDYAQGREIDKIQEIRENFLDSLYNAITKENESIDFDFIYGSVKNIDDNKYFIPLDGQQRLTTLFLLHWYLLTKENRSKGIENIENFKYETRTSSTDFCTALVQNQINIPNSNESNALSRFIKDSSWFFLSWKRDPTIQSMLVMLDAIHSKFYKTLNIFDKLISDDNPPVTFQFIKLENFGLTDNLYIKMNARGKALTDFENFKAKFEQFLDKYHQNKKNEFSKKIDGIWTDLFWENKEDDVIDKPFMRYFYFITEMLYFKNKYQGERTSPFEYVDKKPKVNYRLIEKVYEDKENVNFLFTSLDNISDINNITNNIFSKKKYENDKIALFNDNVKLFERCIKFEDFGIYEKVLLFSIIQYVNKTVDAELDNNLQDYIRVVRNLLIRVRWQDKIEFKSNLRYDFLPNQLSDICNVLFSVKNCYEILASEKTIVENFKGFQQKKSLETEISKARFIQSNLHLKPIIFELEDHELLKGSIHNFDFTNNKDDIASLKKSFIDIWGNKDSLIIRALLTIDDYALNIGWSVLGDRYFFGNGKNWYTILTVFDDEESKTILPRFLKSFMDNSSSLQSMIDNWLNDNSEKNWRYYFIKYPEMTSTNNNLYSWDNDFKIRNLTKSRLSGWHINPYVRTVAFLINDNSICNVNECYSNSAYVSPLRLTNNIELHCESEGWKIALPEGLKLSKKISLDLNIESDYLKTDDKRDIIEIAVEFSKKSIDK